MKLILKKFVIFAEAMCSPAEYHKNFTSLVENYLERDCATGVLEYFCRGNEQSGGVP